MISKSIKNKVLIKHSIETFKRPDDCKVSQASNELMLDRFYNGKNIEFPFSH